MECKPVSDPATGLIISFLPYPQKSTLTSGMLWLSDPGVGGAIRGGFVLTLTSPATPPHPALHVLPPFRS